MKFLSIGECMLELSPRGEGLFAQGYAGDTFNTAWYMAQVAGPDIETFYLTAVGDDLPSRQMTDFMEASGVTPMAKRRKDRSVGLYMIVLNKGERSFLYWRDHAAAKTLADDLDELPLKAGDIAYFSGITLAILSPAGRENLFAALSASKASGVTIVFDPNLRPRLWGGLDEMRDWTTRGASLSDLCLPSFEDEATYFTDRAPEDTGKRYLANGSKQVIVKNGPDPIAVCEAGSVTYVDIDPLADIVDTTAAGDSFNAQFCASYFSGSNAVDAAKEAAAMSRKVISQPGALVAL
ncbi:MAG: sugar kinase [Pseudomonadota bacterium]